MHYFARFWARQGGSGDFKKKAQTLLQTFKIQTVAPDFAPDFGAECRRGGRRTEAPRQSTVRVNRSCGIVLGFGARRWRRVCVGKGRAFHGRAKRLWRQTFFGQPAKPRAAQKSEGENRECALKTPDFCSRVWQFGTRLWRQNGGLAAIFL
jgi:hypothetical protein